MADRFNEFIERLLSHEGGYSDDRTDPGNWTGGAVGMGSLKGTKFGISASAYPQLSIKTLSRKDAIEIYREDFWLRSKADRLPPVAAFQLLDGAVNSGIVQAARWLQRSVGAADDGMIGPATLAAINLTDPNDLVMRFLAQRLDFMTRLKNWPSAGAGWARRIAANLNYAAQDN